MKRFSSFLLSLIFLGSLLIPGTAFAEPSSKERIFLDVGGDHAYSASIQYLKNKGIMTGYQTEAALKPPEQVPFRPDFQLNRAELVKIMIEAQVKKEEISSCDKSAFPDVPKDVWFAPYVCVAKKKGIVSGYPDGTFKPEQPVNFAEAAKIISNSTGLEKPGSRGDEVWFTPFVKSLSVRKAVPPSIRSFGKKITRAEMSRMIHAAKEEVAGEVIPFEELEELNKKDDELPQIEACDELIEKLELNRERPVATPYDFGMRGPLMTIEEESVEKSTGEVSENSQSSDDYSTTNVQVKGVDEADIVKNDGKYIYLIKGKTVRIVMAYPGEELEELKKIELDDENFSPLELYVDHDQMVIIGSTYHSRAYDDDPFFNRTIDGISSEKMMFYPPIFNETRMKVYVVDIQDRRKATVQRKFELEGNYVSSRKVGKNVYFVLNQHIPYYYLPEENKTAADVILPRYKDSALGEEERPLVSCTDVLYFPNVNNRQYLIVAGLDISDDQSKLNTKVVIGDSGNIYASKENMYVASIQYHNVKRLMRGESVEISEPRTLIYRFKLSGDEIEYETQGSVPGTILNQFSMDESGEYFRIATTGEQYDPEKGSLLTNNLFVLKKESMDQVGRIRDMAPGERIKSVRFIGDRGYMVTFKNIDPLFVIDLKNPEDPKILGELKIPGWSDYLHPYDETHLIGFGREVDPKAEESGFITWEHLLGMKISLFDVSDVASPKEMFKEVIGTRGTESEVLRNHKALLFDREKKLLAFPITITELKDPTRKDLFAYENSHPTFAGGIVYTIDLEKGFQLRGKVSHSTAEEEKEFARADNFNRDYRKVIKRLLFIGKYLYGISENHVSAGTLDTVQAIKQIELDPGDDPVDPIFYE